MKNRSITKGLVGAIGLLMLSSIAFAQQPAIQYFRYYDKRGVNVFETSKTDTIPYEGLKIRFGAGFTQGYQNLSHSNGLPAPSALYEMGGGFPLAQANFNIDVQLYDGVSLNLVSYMSSHHHNEFWVKGGYLQIDKVGFMKSEFFDKLWKNLTLKVGHMEVNYGDAHFRRSDGGHTLWNPFIENNIMDAFTTEIGAELYWKKDGLFIMGGYTDGEIQGNVAAPSTPAGAKRAPSFYGKVGFDKQLKENLRVRLTGSVVTTSSSASNTLFGGDRAGSNYQYVMENAPVTLTGNSFSGRFNPGFRDNLTAFVINPFVKFGGLEVFGTFESATGKNSFENGEGVTGYSKEPDRMATQTAVEALYRFGKTEQFYVGARYNTVAATIAEGYSATVRGTRTDVTIDRTSIAAGWFITPSILLKGEYVTQNYGGFLATGANNRFYNGKFDGFVIQGAISF
ncbi:MAG: hypothetical protein ACK5YT_00215 [Bacteroidota bacterium]